MNRKFGIDVSKWQGDFNFEKAVAEGVEFVILKAGGGDDCLYKDSKFESNYNKCRTLGIPVGAYFFGRATTIDKAREEAYYFISLLKDKQFEYPVYYDVEGRMVTETVTDTLTDIVVTFCNIMEDAGYWVGIYSSQSYFNCKMYDDLLTRYSHWVACWGKSFPELCSKSEVQMWQFGGDTNKIRTNKIAGVTCDQNYCYYNYPTEIKNKGLNGFSIYKNESESIQHDKTIDELAEEVLEGKWGNGDERKSRLTTAGYDYESIQSKVNILLTKKSDTEIAKEVIAGKWGNGKERKNKITYAGYDYDNIQTIVNNMMKGK